MKRPEKKLEEWEWIEKYWSGRLSPEENLFFEKEMKENDQFAGEAESLRYGVQLFEEARFEENAKQTLRRLQQTGRNRRKLTRLLSLTAGFASAACIAFALYLSYAPLKLPAQENDLSILRDFRNKFQSDSTNGLSMAKKQSFDVFFEGQSFLAEGETRLAQARFEKVLSYPDLRPYFKESVKWHLVICYLKNDQIEKASKTYDDLRQSREYSIPPLERWKIWWHLKRSQLGGGA